MAVISVEFTRFALILRVQQNVIATFTLYSCGYDSPEGFDKPEGWPLPSSSHLYFVKNISNKDFSTLLNANFYNLTADISTKLKIDNENEKFTKAKILCTS